MLNTTLLNVSVSAPCMIPPAPCAPLQLTPSSPPQSVLVVVMVVMVVVVMANHSRNHPVVA